MPQCVYIDRNIYKWLTIYTYIIINKLCVFYYLTQKFNPLAKYLFFCRYIEQIFTTLVSIETNEIFNYISIVDLGRLS